MEKLYNQELKNLLMLNYYLSYHFLKKKNTIKAKIKQLSTKKALSEQPFYKQPIKNPSIKKLRTSNYYVSYHFMMILTF